MAQIELRLSSKIQKETGRSEIMIRFYQGSKFDLYAKSEVYVSPDFFEYYVNRAKTKEMGVRLPDNVITSTLAKAERQGYALRKSGEIVISKRIETPEVKYHKEQEAKIISIKQHILEKFEEADKGGIKGDWLKDAVDRFNHPEKYITAKAQGQSFYELGEDYIKKRDLAESHARVFRVLFRAVARYEGFVRATDASKKDFSFDIDKITRDDIEDFSDYLRNEKSLSEEYPSIFAKLLEDYPLGVRKGRDKLEERGENTIIKMRARLKSLFIFFYDEGKTTNRPFEGVRIGTAKVGTPYYITIDERNQIADADLQTKWESMTKEEQQKARTPLSTLMTQRDIFVFQCLIGCRVGDLLKLTERHIHDGILVYTPHKTKDGEDAMQARVPLHPKALALIEKYRGADAKGRLFPFITAQKYNDAIKVIFTMAGVTRNVEVRNPKTGENEIRPINEIASSHLARRTFVGNAYFKVHDPNLIGKMSGHVEGSKAFKRYRKIEDETLKEVIDLIG